MVLKLNCNGLNKFVNKRIFKLKPIEQRMNILLIKRKCSYLPLLKLFILINKLNNSIFKFQSLFILNIKNITFINLLLLQILIHLHKLKVYI